MQGNFFVKQRNGGWVVVVSDKWGNQVHRAEAPQFVDAFAEAAHAFAQWVHQRAGG